MARNAMGTSNSSRDLTLNDIVRSLIRGAPLALAVTAAALIAAVAVTISMPPTYQASVGLLASTPPSNFAGLDIITPPAVDPRVYQRVLLDGPLIHDALVRVDGLERSEGEIREFKKNLGVTVEDQQISAIIRVNVRDTDPERAAAYANALAGELVEWDRARARLMVDNTIAALEQAIVEIDSQIAHFVSLGNDPEAQRQQALAATLREQRVRELDVATARGASAVMVGLLEPFNWADPPEQAVGPRPVLNAFIAIVLGLFFGYGVQFAAWSLSKEVRSRDRLLDLTGAPVFATLPRPRRGRKRYTGDAIGYLRAGLVRRLGGKRNIAVAITSPSSFDDKAGLAIALAESLARSGNRVLVVDGDLRQHGPGLGVSLGQLSVPGFDAYLRNPGLSIQPASIKIDQQVSFEFIPTTTQVRQANELLEYGLQAFLKQATQYYEVVLVDLPPVLANPDASVAAARCAGVVLCASTTNNVETVNLSLEALRDAGALLLGSVLSGVPVRSRSTSESAARVQAPLPNEDSRSKPSQRVVARVKSR